MNKQAFKTVEDVAADIHRRAADCHRYTVAIAGPPAAGKTTLAQKLASILSRQTTVVVVAMDGFHFDNAVLTERNLLHRKGSPQTFDVSGFNALLERLQAQGVQAGAQTSGIEDGESGLDVAVPVFDRELDLSRACAQVVSPADRIVLVEGNYLLLQQAPWESLFGFFDHRIFLNPPLDIIEQRLIDRWIHHNHTKEEAIARAHSNDLPNAKTVLENSTTDRGVLLLPDSLGH